MERSLFNSSFPSGVRGKKAELVLLCSSIFFHATMSVSGGGNAEEWAGNRNGTERNKKKY